MNGLLKIMTIGAVIFGSYSVLAQSGKPNLSGQQNFVQKLDKKVDLDSKQEKQILQIKQKEAQKIKKYQDKIDKTRLDAKIKIEKKLTPEQKAQLEKKNKKAHAANWKKGQHPKWNKGGHAFGPQQPKKTGFPPMPPKGPKSGHPSQKPIH